MDERFVHIWPFDSALDVTTFYPSAVHDEYGGENDEVTLQKTCSIAYALAGKDRNLAIFLQRGTHFWPFMCFQTSALSRPCAKALYNYDAKEQGYVYALVIVAQHFAMPVRFAMYR